MKLVPKLLRSCGLSSGVCGDKEHFIRKKDTTVEGKRVKYRVYGLSKMNLDQMIELDVLEQRQNIERKVKGNETKLENAEIQRFRDLEKERIRET